MLNRLESLFDTRGGSGVADRCEHCNEPLDPEAISPVCEDCHRQESEDE